MDFRFRPGIEYNRVNDLHEPYGGSRQSGISSSRTSPVVFLFTGEGGAQHGYEDRFLDDGRFLYTGAGQVGDMKFVRGNKAIVDHKANAKHLLLFEQTRPGFCKYLGEYVYVGHHIEDRPDREGTQRRAIIFELAMLDLEQLEELEIAGNEAHVTKPVIPMALSLTELRQLAQSGRSRAIAPRTIEATVHIRSIAVKRYALARARGVCECCEAPAPFRTKKKEPYLEVHHLFRLADGGPDIPEGVAAICPTCHRRIHVGEDGQDTNRNLIRLIESKEQRLRD